MFTMRNSSSDYDSTGDEGTDDEIIHLSPLWKRAFIRDSEDKTESKESPKKSDEEELSSPPIVLNLRPLSTDGEREPPSPPKQEESHSSDMAALSWNVVRSRQFRRRPTLEESQIGTLIPEDEDPQYRVTQQLPSALEPGEIPQWESVEPCRRGQYPRARGLSRSRTYYNLSHYATPITPRAFMGLRNTEEPTEPYPAGRASRGTGLRTHARVFMARHHNEQPVEPYPRGPGLRSPGSNYATPLTNNATLRALMGLSNEPVEPYPRGPGARSMEYSHFPSPLARDTVPRSFLHTGNNGEVDPYPRAPGSRPLLRNTIPRAFMATNYDSVEPYPRALGSRPLTRNTIPRAFVTNNRTNEQDSVESYLRGHRIRTRGMTRSRTYYNLNRYASPLAQNITQMTLNNRNNDEETEM